MTPLPTTRRVIALAAARDLYRDLKIGNWLTPEDHDIAVRAIKRKRGAILCEMVEGDRRDALRMPALPSVAVISGWINFMERQRPESLLMPFAVY